MDYVSRTHNRGVLTLAFGKQRYIEMAKSLGRSLALNAPKLPRAVVTDSTDPELASLFAQRIPYRPELGSNLRQKLHLDLYSPYEECLFIDSDCLVLSDLSVFWKAFEHQYFGVLGWRELRTGDTDPDFDVDVMLDRFKVDVFAKFNGGIYYFRNSTETNDLFAMARKLLTDYRELGFNAFRGDGPNEEAIMSVAMAIQGCTPTWMGPRGMWTPISCRGGIKLDVEKGFCQFEKEGRLVTPDVVHFAGEYAASYAYVRASLRLRRVFGSLPRGISENSRALLFSWLWTGKRRAKNIAKDILRNLRQFPNPPLRPEKIKPSGTY